MKTLAALLLLPFVADAQTWNVLEPARLHLRSGTNAEWEEFSASTPQARRLDLRFVASSNTAEHSLFLWQDEVKLDWRVELNGRRLGSLFLMEAPLTWTLRLPPGTLRDGTNLLSIIPPRDNDDIRVGEIRLAPKPIADVLGESTIHFEVADEESGKLLPCRVTVADAAGSLAAFACATNARIAARPGVIYSADGTGTFQLLAGRYTISATRGFEYSLAATNITVGAGETRRVQLKITREVDTRGLVSCDTHVHTFTYSRHGDATVDERVVTLAGEGIELPVATDHDILVDLIEPAQRTGTIAHFTPVIGDEVTTRVGHFNIFPVRHDTKIPDNKQTNWTALLESFRATPDVRVVVFNHPRNVHNGFQPFAQTHFNHVTAEPHWPFDFRFDAIELVNSSAQQSDYMSVFKDWFALLNAGHVITGVGSSDGHDVSRYIVGQGRTYIACDDTDPAKIKVEEACSNLVAGRAYVSMGLLPILTVNDRHHPGDLMTNAGSSLQFSVQVRAPSWIQADTVQLFANGVKVREERIAAAQMRRRRGVAANVSWTIPAPKHDTWYVVIATGPGDTGLHWPIPKPYQPASPAWTSRVIGSTNPVRLDGDGDGKFSAARVYAGRCVEETGGEPRALVKRLAAFDEAVAIQAAAWCGREGIDARSDAFREALAAAPPHVRRGFNAVEQEAAALPRR